MDAPNECPICGESEGWKLIDVTKKGFNSKKAIIGGALLGVVGLAAGVNGKKKALYLCSKCGFSHEYDGVAKSLQPTIPKGYKNKGLYSTYIDIIQKATPDCVFCGVPQDLYIKYERNLYHFLCARCFAEFRCDFTFGGKVKSKSVQILNCGIINKNDLEVGSCEADTLIKDEKFIK